MAKKKAKAKPKAKTARKKIRAKRPKGRGPSNKSKMSKVRKLMRLAKKKH